MREYPIKIKNLADLINFESFVRKNNLHGELRQRDFKANIRSGLILFMGLPFNNASVVLEDCPAVHSVEVEKQLAAF